MNLILKAFRVRIENNPLCVFCNYGPNKTFYGNTAASNYSPTRCGEHNLPPTAVPHRAERPSSYLKSQPSYCSITFKCNFLSSVPTLYYVPKNGPMHFGAVSSDIVDTNNIVVPCPFHDVFHVGQGVWLETKPWWPKMPWVDLSESLCM